MPMAKFYKWGGGGVPVAWSFGWLTGKDGDLVCVTQTLNEENARQADWVLSPVCSNRVYALTAFLLKAIVVAMDQNVARVKPGE